MKRPSIVPRRAPVELSAPALRHITGGVADEEPIRSGFVNAGPSQFNRVIER